MKKKDIRRLEKLSKASRDIMGNLMEMTLDERLTLIARHMAEILEAEASGVLLVRLEGVLSFEVGFGYMNQESLIGQKFPICNSPNSGLTGYIAYEGVPFNKHGHDLIHHFAVRGEKPKHLPSGECHSLLAMPLKKKEPQGERLLGLIRVDNKKGLNGRASQRFRFTEEDEWILSIFADAVVAALDNAEVVKQMLEQKDHLAGLVSSSPDGIIAFDRQGNVTLFNDRAEQILGYTAQEVICKPLALFDNPKAPSNFSSLMPQNNCDGQRVRYESLVRNKAGESVLLRHSSTRLYDAKGEHSGLVGYFEDLRSVRKAERQQKLLAEAMKIVGQAESLHAGMRSLASMMSSILPHTFCRILMLDETKQLLEVSAVCYEGDCPKVKAALWQPVLLCRWPGLMDSLNRNTLKPFHLGNVEHQLVLKKLSRVLELDSDIQTLLVVPLKLGDKVVGFLEFAETEAEQVRSFSKDETNFCAAIAARMSILINRMHMHERTKQSELRLKALHQALLHLRADRGESALLPELVRMGVKLVGCSMGGLFINHPQLKELELKAGQGLPAELLYTRMPYGDGPIGKVAQTGCSRIEHNYTERTAGDTIFAALKIKALIAVALQNEAGQVEAVLFIADDIAERQFAPTDLEIIECLAAQASLELQTSRLLTQKQLSLSKLNTLNGFSNYAQAEERLDKILHVVLTGVTADYGLRLNRAALLTLSADGKTLIGQMGIGNLDEQVARLDWEQDEQQGLNNLNKYIELLEGLSALPSTPVDDKIKNLRVPTQTEEPNIFHTVIEERRLIRLNSEDLKSFPEEFVAAFEPALPCVVAPLVAREQVVGILVADNKFNQVPITDEDVKLLHSFINGITIALDKSRLLKQMQAGLSLQHALSEANVKLFSGQNPRSVLEDIVKQTPAAVGASWVRVILIDDLGCPVEQIIGGRNADYPLAESIRPDGISIRVMSTKQAVVIEDVSQQRERVNPFVLNQGIQATLCFPLTLQGKSIGVMWINYDRPRRFQPFEIDALQLYANQSALAYSRARQVDELERLHKAAEAMSGAVTLDYVLRTIVEEAADMFQADSACVWSYDHVRDKFLPDEVKAVGISDADLQIFKDLEPVHQGTIYAILNRGWLDVINTANESGDIPGREIQEHLLRIGVRSFQGIALQVVEEDPRTGNKPTRALLEGNKPTGVLYLNYNKARTFNDEDRRALKNFATYAALALKNARLLEQVRRIKGAAEVVAEVSTLEEDPNATLLSIVEGTRHALGCDAVVLYAYDETKNKWHYPPINAGVNFPEAAWPNDKVPATSIVFKIFKLVEKFYIAEHGAEDKLGLLKGRFARDEKIVSCMALPLMAAGRNVGVMFVNYRTRTRFTSDDLSNIKLFAGQAAVAIRNFQLFKASQRKLIEQKTLVEFSQALLGDITRQEIINRAVKVATQLLGVDHCNIVLRSDNGKLILSAADGWDQGLIGQCELAEGEGSQTGYTIETGQPVVVEDLELEERFAVHPVVRERGVKSSMSVPMFSEDEMIGAMLVHTNNYHQFTAEQVNLLSLIAYQTAIAIQSARRYEDLKRTQRMVVARNAVAWMGMASSVWGHAVNGHAITIKEKVMLMERELISNAPTSIAPELLAAASTRLLAIAEVADGILNKVITPPLSADNANSVLIDVLVRNRIKKLWDNGHYNRFPFPVMSTAGTGVSVLIDEFWFNQALDQLIDNSINAMTDSEFKQLRLDIQSTASFVEISITDTGGGISPEVQSRLFKEQIKKTPGVKGLGIGLMMVQCIVEAYRGEVEVGSTGPNGTTMVIRLPFEKNAPDGGGKPDFLLISDSKEQYWSGLLKEILTPLGRLEAVGEQAVLKRMSEQDYRAVIIDAGVIDDFAPLTSRLRTHHHNARIIIVTPSAEWEFAREAFRAGATDYLRRSVNKQELLLTLKQALAKPLLPWPR